jgi:hypothetical protein
MTYIAVVYDKDNKIEWSLAVTRDRARKLYNRRTSCLFSFRGQKAYRLQENPEIVTINGLIITA